MAGKTAADRKLERELEQSRIATEKAEFAAKLPMILLELMARADKYSDVRYKVQHPENGLLRVEFKVRTQEYDEPTEYKIYLTTEQWEVENLIRDFDAMDAAALERARIRKVAQEAYDMLTEEQRNALGVRRPV